MSWTISLDVPENEALLERYFVAVGKALCIASNFEQKCNDALQMHRVTNAIQKGKPEEEVADISKSFEKIRLHNAINEIGSDDDVSEAEKSTLHNARESRNFVAHEAGAMGEVGWVDNAEIYGRVENLLPHVRQIAKGENVVSAWIFEMSERQPAPRGFTSGYVQQVIEWVFQNLLEKQSVRESEWSSSPTQAF